ncbi:low molecular weight protein-tyrosine-phosphatase [Piscirickettsia litoralis]|uniref:protein-tyrosine-phosphatase n=1 Tax=Piscirickettsia litoralis TaxID=1891921 RepID=A0ABX3A670_9GAMM|nr:low molecular weight protein-tyrosine-phosphatase [Piscirickettsia litoralis]ODN42980.1 protein tyrosine phosphatase [Piscirickettsia litoralis]
MFNKILMVCVGNICRSPVAEALLKAFFHKNAIGGKAVESAGIAALIDNSADQFSIELMTDRNIDIQAHRARQLTAELVKEFDLILVMEDGHRKHIEKEFAFSRGKVHCLGKWRNEDISDPYKEPREAFVKMVDHVEVCLEDWITKFWLKS